MPCYKAALSHAILELSDILQVGLQASVDSSNNDGYCSPYTLSSLHVMHCISDLCRHSISPSVSPGLQCRFLAFHGPTLNTLSVLWPTASVLLLQVQGLKAYAEDGATRQKAQSLCKHKWAKAIWEGEFNGPARKEYLDLVLHREL